MEVESTNDSGFIVVGTSMSTKYPGLILKLADDGSILWQKVHQTGGGLNRVEEAEDG